MSFSKPSVLVLLFFACCLLLPLALYSQDFISIETDLTQLQNLIANTLLKTEEQQILLENLQKNLSESGNLVEDYGITITMQEKLLEDLQIQLNIMSEIYTKQSALSVKYGKSSKFWRTFTLIAIPVTALISGSVVWVINK